LRAQEGLTLTYIAWHEEPQAKAVFQELVSAYCENEHVPATIDDIADEYRELGSVDKARQCYQDIVSRWPQAEHAVQAKAGVARSSILLGDEAAAQAAVADLLSGYAGNAQKPEAIDHVADQYRDLRRFEDALPLYQYIVDNWGQTKRAMESQRGVTLCYVGLGDDPNAEAAVQKLAADFSGNPELPALLYDMANGYENARKFDKAKAIYQQVVQIAPQYPDSRHGPTAPLDVRKADILALIDSGQHEAVQSALNSVIADFSGNGYLATVVYKVAVQYHMKAYALLNEQGLGDEARAFFLGGAALFQRVINDYPDSWPIPRAYRSAGDCHRKLGDFQKSITFYQALVDNYPNFRTAGNALLLVGRNYEELKESGAMPEADADAKIKAAYERLLERYPACQGSDYARLWLEKYGGSH
jgi:tetratricopeptide (TPR) repeat protein